ncbi:hypothetical protein J7E71_13070 [Mesobacillus foraminis]|uniref:hypothetical protein n=1 Tax=Mesobacillus foraminis TaxID=279826 RepID=UPI001BE56E1A|nr:hypothetical protein [Mesobacillus foraminis]MBT2756878.1 hypothetical protein [Mesobacillus foraminis]
MVLNEKDEELTAFSSQEGIAWAEHSLTLSLKLEWVQAIRRTLWHYIAVLSQKSAFRETRVDFFDLEKRINDQIDQFLNSFSSATQHIRMFLKQREVVEHLSVPIIPVSATVSVLPLIGAIYSYRIEIIEEKVLNNIADSRIQTLVIDLSV